MINAFAQTLAIIVLVLVGYVVFRGVAFAVGALFPDRKKVPLEDFERLHAQLIAEKETNRQLQVRLDKEVERGVNQRAVIERLQRPAAPTVTRVVPERSADFQGAIDEAVREVLEKQEYPEHDIGGEG